MRSIFWFGSLAAALFFPSPSMAQTAGTWRVSGDIDGKSFVLNCRFDERSAQLGGSCTEVSTDGKAAKPGKIHPLSQGSVQGQDVRWSYSTKVIMMSVDIEFSGTLIGKGMVGEVHAKGHRGTFSAIRV